MEYLSNYRLSLYDDISVYALGYVVSQNGILYEVDMYKEHKEVFNTVIAYERNIPISLVNYEKHEGFKELTDLGYIVYVGPLERTDLTIDTYNDILNDNTLMNGNYYAGMYLPNDKLSPIQQVFINKLLRANCSIFGDTKCSIDTGYYDGTTLSNEELYELVEFNKYTIIRNRGNINGNQENIQRFRRVI